MGSIEPPRQAGASAPEQVRVQEPPTGRALWPTFMRRTLAEEELRAAAAEAHRG